MEFQDQFFESEVREGFYITSMMKRSWAAQLEILKDVDEVCTKYGISYFADAGTLLGAVRHRGFIPWDDDLDICMMRKDYHRFISVAEKELPEGYLLRNIHTDTSYTELFTRVLNSREINFKSDFLNKFHGCPYGMGIDVFVMDYLPSSAKESEFLRLVIKTIDELVTAAVEGKLGETDLAEKIAMIEHMLHVQIDANRPWMNQMLCLEERLFAMYSAQEADDITVMPIWIKNDNHKWPKSWYEKSIRMPFENRMVPVPAMYDSVLWKKFGDYMHNVKSAGMHDYPIFLKQEIALKEKVGRNPYVYTFSEKDLCSQKGTGKYTVKKQIKEFLNLLKGMHEKVNRWGEHMPEALAVLEECQESAILAGTTLEKEIGKNNICISNLEKYCELVYQIHEAMVQNRIPDVERLFILLDNQIEQIEISIHKEIDLRYEVVFLPYQAALWPYLESIWEAAGKDQDCISYVIPVPYFYRKPDGSAGELHDETDLFPDYVPTVRYDNFDFAGHNPDVIYIQNPYDEYDIAMSVHPFFYAANLKKYTDRLVYIPPYYVKEISENDERAISNIKYSCAAPGVVYADKVIVQSEKMRQIYVDILTDFSGEQTRRYWEEKVLGLGSPKADKETWIKSEVSDLPEEWTSILIKPDGIQKKVVLYGTNVSALFHYEDAMIEKMKRALTLFSERSQEIALIWALYEYEYHEADNKYQKLWKDFQEMILKYQKDGWGILDKSGDIQRAVKLCDAYYGDRGYAAQFCLDRGVPVMLQDVKY